MVAKVEKWQNGSIFGHIPIMVATDHCDHESLEMSSFGRKRKKMTVWAQKLDILKVVPQKFGYESRTWTRVNLNLKYCNSSTHGTENISMISRHLRL